MKTIDVQMPQAEIIVAQTWMKCSMIWTRHFSFELTLLSFFSLFISPTLTYRRVRIKLLRFFEDILLSRTSSYGTYRYEN